MQRVDVLEAEALKEPLSVRTWIALISAITADRPKDVGSAHGTQRVAVENANRVNAVFERALQHSPYSYKLWTSYIQHRAEQWEALVAADRVAAKAKDRSADGAEAELSVSPLLMFRSICKLYERALTCLPNMPLLWTGYIDFLLHRSERPFAVLFDERQQQGAGDDDAANGSIASRLPMSFTKIRLTILKALHALPMTQHALVWGVFRKWCAAVNLDGVPLSTIHTLWTLMLAGNTSDRALSDYVQLLVRCRANDTLLAYCCTRVGLVGSNSGDAVPAALPRPFRDPLFWELLRGILLQPSDDSSAATGASPKHTADPRAVQSLVFMGVGISLQPDALVQALAVYLIRRGHFGAARKLLRDILATSSNPVAFQDAYATLVRMEQQLIDCIALDEAHVGWMSDDELNAFLRTRIYNSSDGSCAGVVSEPMDDPVAVLSDLVKDYPLLINAVQLRQRPHDVRLWLKRVECIVERSAARGYGWLHPNTVGEMEEVFKQGMTLCRYRQGGGESTAVGEGSSSVPPPTAASGSNASCVSALYVAWSDVLIRVGRRKEATELLVKGAFQTHFPLVHHNVQLFGLLVETLCLSDQHANTSEADDVDARREAMRCMMRILRTELDRVAQWRNEMRGEGPDGTRRVAANRMFLGQMAPGASGGVPPVLTASAMWSIAWDVVFWAEGSAGPCGDELGRWMAELGLYTPDIALLRATKMRASGRHSDAVRCIEEAIGRCAHDHLASLRLADACCAILLDQCLSRGSSQLDTGDERAGAAPASLVALGQLGGTMPRLERLREVVRVGVDHAREAFRSTPHIAQAFLFAAAAAEECIGLYGASLRILYDAVVLTMPPPSLGASGAPAAQSDDANKKRQAVFLQCLDTFARKLLEHRGAAALFVDMADLLKRKMSPLCASEVALRLTAELARCGETTKCRAVFQALAPRQDPQSDHGKIFWGAWSAFERDFGTEDTYMSAQRTKRNIQAANFSKTEVTFEV